MSTALENDLKLALEIAAERMAPGPDFAIKLQLLIEQCREQGVKSALDTQIKLSNDLAVSREDRYQLEDKIKELEVEVASLRAQVAAYKTNPSIVIDQNTLIPGSPPQKPLGPVYSGPKKIETIPHIVPMKSVDQAREEHRKNHPEMYEKDGARKGGAPPIVPTKTVEKVTGKRVVVNDEIKAAIRKRYKQAKIDGGGYRVEMGFLRRLADEYHLSETKVYQIVYSDPDYIAVPRGVPRE